METGNTFLKSTLQFIVVSSLGAVCVCVHVMFVCVCVYAGMCVFVSVHVYMCVHTSYCRCTC